MRSVRSVRPYIRPYDDHKRNENRDMKLSSTTFVSVDGVMQAIEGAAIR